MSGYNCEEFYDPIDCIFSNNQACKYDYTNSKCLTVNPTDSILF